MKKPHLFIIVSAVLIAIAFYGGMRFAKASGADSRSAAFAGMEGRFPGGRTRTGGDTDVPMMPRGGENMTRGEIISVDENSVTIKTEVNGSKIVMLSDETQISETVNVPKENLAAGKTVMVTGSADNTGIISADTILIRDVGKKREGE